MVVEGQSCKSLDSMRLDKLGPAGASLGPPKFWWLKLSVTRRFPRHHKQLSLCGCLERKWPCGFLGCHEALPVPTRYAFTVVANITVYGAAWLLLHLQASANTGPTPDVSDQLGVQDVPVFRVSWGWGGGQGCRWRDGNSPRP